MITLFDAAQKDLSQDDIQKIFELLKINPAPDITDFLNDPNLDDDEKDFHNFFFDVLVENNIPCAIEIDWKWEPDDLFWQLERYFPTLKLTHNEWIPSDSCYQINYMLHGKSEAVEVAFDNPDGLFESLSHHLTDCKFIALNFLEDGYAWLIIPNDFNIELFCTLTGLVTEKPAPTREEAPKNFGEGYKQTEKLFFKPTIFYIDESQIGYTMPGQLWAGRILPGQTIREGIATELKMELNYTGRFDYSYDGFEGTFKDRKGHDIKRYRLTVHLFDKTFQSKMAGGADIRLQKIPNKTFYHPDAAQN